MELTRSILAESLFYLNNEPFSLDDYKHMRPIYDSMHDSTVLQTSRQVSKCQIATEKIRLVDGSIKTIKNLNPGDKLLSFDETSHKVIINKIKSVKDNGNREIYFIKTRTGKELKITAEHPIWTLYPKWTIAKNLEVGDFIGISKNNSIACPTKKTVRNCEYRILSFLLMEGGLSQRNINFTNSDKINIDELSKEVKKFDPRLSLNRKISTKYGYTINGNNEKHRNILKEWLKQLNLWDKKSENKFLPDLFFKLTKKQIFDALRIVWNTDGYISINTNGFPNIGISLISKELIKGIQELLLRVGIHSTISEQIPNIYRNTAKKVYVLRIEGEDSRKKFYCNIKTFKLKNYKKTTENNNGIVIPKKALNFLKNKYGLSWTLGYSISYDKLKKLNEHLKDEYIKKILNADIIYDKIEKIEKIGKRKTIAIEMEPPSNTYLIDNVITHNSTTLANMMLANSIMYPGFKSLYVSPTVDQTKIFSSERVATVMEQSPYIKNHLLSNNLNQNVFTKQLKNHSKMFLRYALLNADRLRGISADANYFDECYAAGTEVLTDRGWILFDNLSESTYRNFKYATVNSKQKIEFQKPTRFVKRKHSGKIIEFSHRNFKLRTTSGHNMFISQKLNTGYYRNPKVRGWNLVKARDVVNKNFKMISSGEFKSKSPEYILLPQYDTKINLHGKKYQNSIVGEKYPIKPFMQFMGWYLSEGHVSNSSNDTILSQKEGQNAIEIREILNQLFPNNYSENINKMNNIVTFIIHNKNLYDYLSKFNKSSDKFIPPELLNYTDHLIFLLDALYKGGGMKHEGEEWGDLNTPSKKLADSVQIAWMYLNKKATIRQVTEKDSGTILYKVCPQFLNYMVFWNSSKRIKYIDYNGYVYCVTVPNSTLIVRDSIEKTAVVCGNCQDLLPEIIPVVQETMSRSMFKWNMFSGTPKTSTTFLAKLWRESTKNEWMVKCHHTGCKKWNYLDDKNLGDTGPICRYCGKPLNTREGVWVTTGTPKAIHQGFRINILMFADAPWVKWQRDVIDYRKIHDDSIFFNEKLGLEYDSGVKPVTLDEIRACCTGGPMQNTPDPIIASKPCYLGVDYGPTNSKKSNTVLAVIQNEGNKLKVVYAKKYLGPEASYSYIHEDVPKQFKTWNGAFIGADYGMGEAPNSEIRKAIGFKKVIAYQHVPNQKERSQWNPKMPAFTLNRTEVMGNYFQKIKHKEIIFPRWEDFEPFANDILNINTEYDETRGKVSYTNNDPDDFFQALIYGGETATRHKMSSIEVY